MMVYIAYNAMRFNTPLANFMPDNGKQLMLPCKQRNDITDQFYFNSATNDQLRTSILDCLVL